MAKSQDGSEDLRRSRRRALRQQSTTAEKLVWWGLRDRRLAGLKFRRQHSIGGFIVDFVCLQRKLIVELDGDYHDYVYEQDRSRQRYLEEHGYRVIRFANSDVLNNAESVLMAISQAATSASIERLR